MRDIRVEFTNSALAFKYAKYGPFCKSLTVWGLQICLLLDPRKKPVFAIISFDFYY